MECLPSLPPRLVDNLVELLGKNAPSSISAPRGSGHFRCKGPAHKRGEAAQRGMCWGAVF